MSESCFILPSHVVQLIGSVPAIGISGSRAPASASLAALAALAAHAPAGGAVLVGDAPGIDHRAAELLPQARVLAAAAFGSPRTPGHARLVARSVACVRACAAARGVWCAFPAQACPTGLRPSVQASACFAGFGSGTWASLALALGLGLPAVVFLPAGVQAPAGWGLAAAGAGWHTGQPPAQRGLW
ncbi:MAG: hypothetical protein IPP13_28515 [Kouleothrix sp.]|jgi:hypothetical protein|nr:hypothetical protein [Kouleothrix sp.]